MSKEEKDIGKIMEEMLNRPLELIEENKKLKKKIGKLQKENQELKRCIDAQKIMRKDMPKDTKLILMYSEDYKRIFKEE